MSAAYSVADYMAPFLVCTLGSMLAVGVLCVVLVRKLTQRYHRLWLMYPPVVGYVVFLCLLCWCAFPVLEQTGDLLVPDEYEMKSTAGEITGITPAEHVPLYLIDGKIYGADNVTIDGTTYYVISDGTFAEGMLVEVQYAHFENNVILQWQEVSEDRVAALKEQPQIIPTEKPQEQPVKIPQNIYNTAKALRITGIVGFVCLVTAMKLMDEKIAKYLLKKDAEVYGRIIPNRAALLGFALPMLFLSMFVVGGAMASGAYEQLFVLAVGLGIMAVLMFIDQSTYLELDGRHLLFRELGKQKHCTVEDIYYLKWETSRRKKRKSLRIVLGDGANYTFSMDTHVGLQNTYNDLKKQLDQHSSVTLNK